MKKILVIVGGGRPGEHSPNWWTRLSAEHRRLGTRWRRSPCSKLRSKAAWAATPAAMESPVQKDGFQGVPIKSWPPI